VYGHLGPRICKKRRTQLEAGNSCEFTLHKTHCFWRLPLLSPHPYLTCAGSTPTSSIRPSTLRCRVEPFIVLIPPQPLDELPQSVGSNKHKNLFCRSLFRLCGLVDVLSGTDYTAKNAVLDHSRVTDESVFWAEAQTQTQPVTLDSLVGGVIVVLISSLTPRACHLVHRNAPPKNPSDFLVVE
jgi:hypothetical protein